MLTYLEIKRDAGDRRQWRGIVRMLHNFRHEAEILDGSSFCTNELTMHLYFMTNCVILYDESCYTL